MNTMAEILSIDPAEMERWACEHDRHTGQIGQWSVENVGFAEEYLATHGLVNFGTYLKIQEYLAAKAATGAAYAERQALTAENLRLVTAAIVTTDVESAIAVAAPAAADGATLV